MQIKFVEMQIQEDVRLLSLLSATLDIHNNPLITHRIQSIAALSLSNTKQAPRNIAKHVVAIGHVNNNVSHGGYTWPFHKSHFELETVFNSAFTACSFRDYTYKRISMAVLLWNTEKHFFS